MRENSHAVNLSSLDAFLPQFCDVADRAQFDSAAWSALWNEPRLRAIALVGVPEAYNPHPFVEAKLGREQCDYVLHIRIVEYLSRGGASALMMLPGSSLSTSAVLHLGTQDQIERFFSPYRDGAAWSFFAITEPEYGSDIRGVKTTLIPDKTGWRLSGTKMFIGGAPTADTGLVLARRADTGEHVLVMVCDCKTKRGVNITPLSPVGLSGARLSSIEFHNVPLSADTMLKAANNRPALVMLADVFERHRPMVGAMALGSARGLLDILSEQGVPRSVVDPLTCHYRVLRDRMLAIAERIERGAGHSAWTSSFKLQAVRLIDRLRERLAEIVPMAVLTDPIVRRLYRDGGAFEYMEGCSNIHVLNAFRAINWTTNSDGTLPKTR